MSSSVQNVPNFTNKYRKYLGKFEDAVIRENHHKLNLYTEKLRMYGMLLQSGGTLDEQLKIVMDSVNKSLDNLGNNINIDDITAKVIMLKNKFEELTNKYTTSMQTFIKNTQEIDRRLKSNLIKPITNVDDLNEFIEETNDIDTYINNVGIRLLINKISPKYNTDDLEKLTDDQFIALEELQIYYNPRDPNSPLINFLNSSNSSNLSKEFKEFKEKFLNLMELVYCVNYMIDNDYQENSKVCLNRINNEPEETHRKYIAQMIGKYMSKERLNTWIEHLVGYIDLIHKYSLNK